MGRVDIERVDLAGAGRCIVVTALQKRAEAHSRAAEHANEDGHVGITHDFRPPGSALRLVERSQKVIRNVTAIRDAPASHVHRRDSWNIGRERGPDHYVRTLSSSQSRGAPASLPRWRSKVPSRNDDDIAK